MKERSRLTTKRMGKKIRPNKKTNHERITLAHKQNDTAKTPKQHHNGKNDVVSSI